MRKNESMTYEYLLQDQMALELALKNLYRQIEDVEQIQKFYTEAFCPKSNDFNYADTADGRNQMYTKMYAGTVRTVDAMQAMDKAFCSLYEVKVKLEEELTDILEEMKTRVDVDGNVVR